MNIRTLAGLPLFVLLACGVQAQTNVARTGRFSRGTGDDPTYHSFVIPLDFQKGVALSNVWGNATNIFGNYPWTYTVYHYNATNLASSTNVALRIANHNPIVAFGSRPGGSPLYYDQEYHFGMYAGFQGPYYDSAMAISVYDRTNFALVTNVFLSFPQDIETNQFPGLVTNGFRKIVMAPGLMTEVRVSEDTTYWGSVFKTPYHITHTAYTTGTNYLYLTHFRGYTDQNFMSLSSSGLGDWSKMCTLEFEERPPWRAVFVDQPHFNGEPLPPFYQGKSLDEIVAAPLLITNVVSLPQGATTYTNLDQSPELRRHPTLDQFVADMGKDPIALASYVQNEIELTDALAWNDNGPVTDKSINLGGVNRSALGTLLEGRGSPTEQCALLVYLLRQAGLPAVYMFAPENGLKMLDSSLSKILRMQIRGAVDGDGVVFTTNRVIPVNYPWVAVYLTNETRWVHVFPWLKDTEIVEGLNLYDQMPTNYNHAYFWLKDYVSANTNILGLYPEEPTPEKLFPRFVEQHLRTNSPGISLDDIGVRFVNRRNSYARWQDFPRPTSVTNTSTAIDSLSDSAITNIYAGLTNIFDLVNIEVYSVTNPTKKIITGDLRMVDLQNRKLLLHHEKISSTSHRMILSLAALRTSATGLGRFTNDTQLLNRQAVTNTLSSTDDTLKLKITHKKHRGFTNAVPFVSYTYPILSETLNRTVEVTLRKGDLVAICIVGGDVSSKMLQVHAEELWNMESALEQNPSLTNTLSFEAFQGTVAYLMGMSYYQRLSRFDRVLGPMHKAHVLTWLGDGLAKFSPKRNSSGQLPNGDIDLVHPNLDVFSLESAIAGNSTLRPDSGDASLTPTEDFFTLRALNASAQEHQVLNRFFREEDAVSTVKLFHIAQGQAATNGQPGVLLLNINNYAAEGEKNYPTNGTTKLKNHSTNLWNNLLTYFKHATASNYAQAFITAGPRSNRTGSFKGMAAMAMRPASILADIGRANGGFGSFVPDYSLNPANSVNFDLFSAPDDSYSVNLSPPSGTSITTAPDATPTFNVPDLLDYFDSGYYVPTDFQNLYSDNTGNLLNGTPVDLGDAISLGGELGNLGNLSQSRTPGQRILDPVDVVTGEFYVDATDLSLAGPMPLKVRRNYSSHNLADNQLGRGWKLSYMPYLSIGTNETIIYAADQDGAVIAYVKGTNGIWTPTPERNPQLNTFTTSGIGSTANPFAGRIEKEVTTNTVFRLFGADGSLRTFEVRSFTNGLVSTRPYLTKWQDNRGNFYAFEYGQDAKKTDYGQVRRVRSSNGSFLGFYYDVYGHIIEAYAGDGRRLYYYYDGFGDLTKVTLPDGSHISYEYERKTISVTNGSSVKLESYSSHLITREVKADGRILENFYDSQRRVLAQKAAVGADLRTYTNAVFTYSNNFNLTNAHTNFVTGHTIVADAYNRTTRYDYASGLITSITNPVGQVTLRDWFMPNETNVFGYYPRSLEKETDPRGLQTFYRYDARGNVTTNTVQGDLTGNGNSGEQAVTITTYNVNNLPTQRVDATGNTNRLFYTNTWLLGRTEFHPTNVSVANIITNTFVYYSVTNNLGEGAFGLKRREIRAHGSSDASTNEWLHDMRGFPTNQVRYTGTSDPNVTNWFVYNGRGELIEQTDAAGRKTVYDYDGLGRPKTREVYEAGQTTPLSWEYSYFNANGDLVWRDGPRYDPEDYLWNDYDGFGRHAQQISWKSRARDDGSGVEAEPGYDLFATTYYEYNLFGDKTRTINARGVITTNAYDAIGRLIAQKVLETNGSVLTTQGFAYEPGGQVAFHTNALNGLTETTYTYSGKPKSRKNADGSTNGWSYYADGREQKQFLSNGTFWETTYQDAARRITKTLKTSAGSGLATNITEFDRRGNVIKLIGVEGHVSTNLFDSLDRIKIAAGPPRIEITPTNAPGNPAGGSGTNVFQQISTYSYDASGQALTVANALGEKTITTSDALGRPVSVEVRSTNNVAVRLTQMGYASNHHGATVYEGTGANSIPTTTYTDNDGQPVLLLKYPTNNVWEYVWQRYDAAGNRVEQKELSRAGSQITTWATIRLSPARRRCGSGSTRVDL